MDRVVEVLGDLSTYSAWLDIVRNAKPFAAAEGDTGPAWSVDLRAQLGPFARSKRLRMCRDVHPDASAHAWSCRFVRNEIDGRSHSPWVLSITADQQTSDTIQVSTGLRYDGSLFGPVIERVLQAEIDAARPRLIALLERPG